MRLKKERRQIEAEPPLPQAPPTRGSHVAAFLTCFVIVTAIVTPALIALSPYSLHSLPFFRSRRCLSQLLYSCPPWAVFCTSSTSGTHGTALSLLSRCRQQ